MTDTAPAPSGPPAPDPGPAPPPAPPTPTDQIRVRMYRVGFGDCFLLTLPTAAGPRHVLVDCGVHSRGNIDMLGPAVENIAQVTDGKLAIVILTHAHQDHLAGFGKFDARFRTFEVGEV